MEWEPSQLDLGALGFAGICRETFRVLRRAILPPNWKGGRGAALLSALLLVGIIVEHALLSRIEAANDGSHLVRFFAGIAVIDIFNPIYFMVVILQVARVCTAAYVFRVATLYCTDGDSGASDRILRDFPRAPFKRLSRTFKLLLPIAALYIIFSGFALAWWFDLLQVEASDEALVLALQMLGGAAFFAGATYIAVVCHIAFVVAALEDYVGLAIVRKSRALLAGKFWAAAAVFVALDGCFVALQALFWELVLEDALGLGSWFQVAAGAAIAVALWAVVVATLVAQPVVYMVCKNHHQEVVDRIHLNYVGEYLPLSAVDGVEMQPVRTEQLPETSRPAPAGSSTST